MQTTYLTSSMLEQLTLRWEAWATEATTPTRKVVRARLYLLFLLIRYGGLRLGEALDMDVRTAIDTVTGMLHVPAPHPRDVLLPLPAMKPLRRILSLPDVERMGVDFLHFDQGFVRKKFYAVADGLDMDSTLVGPRAIRYARGLELLASHVPLNLVQKFLGQQKPAQIAAFLEFAGGRVKELILANLAAKHDNLPQDECNTLLGIVSDITVGMRAASVTVTTFSDLDITALMPMKQFMRMELHLNQVVTVSLDPEQMCVSPEKPTVGLGNCLRGYVTHIHEDTVETFISVELSDGTKLSTTQETRAVQRLNLRLERKISVYFPGRAVRLYTD